MGLCNLQGFLAGRLKGVLSGIYRDLGFRVYLEVPGTV